MGQRLLLSLPAVAAAIVAWAVLAGRGGHVRYAQVLGGPTGTLSSVLVRSLALERDGRSVPSPGVALRLIVESASGRATVTGTTDAAGHVELRLDTTPLPAEPWLKVETLAEPAGSADVLAAGRPSLAPERWREAARRSGGWLSGQTRGTLLVRAAAESGTFAVPFPSALIVQVLEPPSADDPRPSGEEPSAGGMRGEIRTDAEGVSSRAGERPLAGARIELELTGAALAGPVPLTESTGLSRIALHPEEHAVNARIIARAGDRQGEWYGVLPVTPGALVATLAGDALHVRSPIERETAYVSIVSQSARLGGAIVPLEPGVDGSANGSLALDALLLGRIALQPSWVVISSEYDKRSAGAVGWPSNPTRFDPSAPPRTFDVADAVLLDGRAGAIHAAERERTGRQRIAAGALLAVGLLMTGSFWRTVRRSRIRPSRRVSPHDSTPIGTRGAGLRAEDVPSDEAPLVAGGWVMGIALGCIMLGLSGLAYFGLIH